MNSDVQQENASVDASILLNEMKSFEKELAKLSLELHNLSNGGFFGVLSSLGCDSYRKCLDDADLILSKIDAVIEQGEKKQVFAVKETFSELRNTFKLFLSRYESFLNRQRRILQVAQFFSICVAVEAVLWLFLYVCCGASEAPMFGLFTIILIPQVLLGYVVLLWKIGKRIATLYKRRHI